MLDIICLTSTESGMALLAHLRRYAKVWGHNFSAGQSLGLLLGSARIADNLQQYLTTLPVQEQRLLRRLIHPTLIADNPSDSTMIKALVQWKSQLM